MSENQTDIERYRRLLEKDPNSRVFAPLAEACRKAGRLEEALEIARAGVDRHPAYASGRVALARVLLSLENLQEAVAEIERALDAVPDNALAYRLLGEARRRLGDREGAFEAYARALALNPEDEEARQQVEGAGTPPVPEAASPAPVAEEEEEEEPADLPKEAAADRRGEGNEETAPPDAHPEMELPGAAAPETEGPRGEPEGLPVPFEEEGEGNVSFPTVPEEPLDLSDAVPEMGELELELEPVEEAPSEPEILPTAPALTSDTAPSGSEPQAPDLPAAPEGEGVQGEEPGGAGEEVLVEDEVAGDAFGWPAWEASPAADPANDPRPAGVAPFPGETSGPAFTPDVPGEPAGPPLDEAEAPDHAIEEEIENIDTIQSSLAPEALEWSGPPPAVEDPGVSPDEVVEDVSRAEAGKGDEAGEASLAEGAALDNHAEQLADRYIEQSRPENGRVIYRSILANDPLNLRVKKKLIDLGPETTSPPGARAAGDPAVRQKVEENVATLNRWLANIKKGANR
jgi:tetratricopeptide (TPR) repeat protein